MPSVIIQPTPQETTAGAARAAASADRAALPVHAAAAAAANSVPALRQRVADGLLIQERIEARIAALEALVADLKRGA